jgi:hypothetical protein
MPNPGQNPNPTPPHKSLFNQIFTKTMMVTITELTHQIHKAGLSFEITKDFRGTSPGGPVYISIRRNQRPFTDLTLRTLNPIDRKPEETDAYFITHVTIDEAATLRIQKALAPETLWARIYETRLQTINPPRERLHHNHQPQYQSRYVERPSKHHRKSWLQIAMKALIDYILEHSIRGPCICGQYDDAKTTPPRRPTDHNGHHAHTADLVFFKVTLNTENPPTSEKLRQLITEAVQQRRFLNPLNGSEYNYFEIGNWIGDQGLALTLMGLGSLLNLWTLITPSSLTPGIPMSPEMQLVLAQAGRVAIIAKPTNSPTRQLSHWKTKMNIALYTTQIPNVTSPHQEITAIIDLSQQRAVELLELMNDITARANTSSTTFRTTSFEPSALIVPAYALPELPAPNDFVILKNDYIVNAVTPVKLIHANIMPFFINWAATDENDRFTIQTSDLDAEILKIAARGETLKPGTTSQTLNNPQSPSSDTLLTPDGDWLH